MNTLSPFATTDQTKSLNIRADFFQTSGEHLLIEFEISGALDHVAWPASLDQDPRRDGLWQHTCLEAFYSASTDKAAPYTEINCSPNGCWNAYSFSSYRTGMTPSSITTVRLKQRECHSDSARFQIEITSTAPLNIQSLGLAAVIEFANGEKSYWALHHPEAQADFHNKAGWSLATR